MLILNFLKMAPKYLMDLLLILTIFGLVTSTSGLKCLECNPSSAGNCSEPMKYEDQKIDCETSAKISARTYVSDITGYECFHFKNETGEYRGCAEKLTEENLCSSLKKNAGNEMEFCKTCDQDYCNNERKTHTDGANLPFSTITFIFGIFIIIRTLRSFNIIP